MGKGSSSSALSQCIIMAKCFGWAEGGVIDSLGGCVTSYSKLHEVKYSCSLQTKMVERGGVAEAMSRCLCTLGTQPTVHC